MGLFDQMKQATELMKGMDPAQLKDMMARAGEAKKAMDELVVQAVEAEIKRRGLVSREEVLAMINDIH